MGECAVFCFEWNRLCLVFSGSKGSQRNCGVCLVQEVGMR